MNHNHPNHMWIMLVACGGAFLLTLILPAIGVSKNWSSGLAIGAMIGLHLLMMRRHSTSKPNTLNEKGRCHGK